jgi:hypothetical protein
MPKRSMQLPLHFRLNALFRVKPSRKSTCLPRHLPRLSSAPVASRFRYCMKPEVLVKRVRAHCCGRVGRQALMGTGAGARTGARARAPADFEGIHGRAGGSGVAVTASETALFFAKFSKRSRAVHLLPVLFQLRNGFAKPRQNPVMTR